MISDLDELPLVVCEEDEDLETGPSNVTATRDDIINSAKVSLDFLASLVLTDLYSYGYPPILKAMWQLICGSAMKHGRVKDRFALGIPRGFSKTIMLKLYCLWIILFTDRKFILVVAATDTHAQNFITDVASMLDHVNILATFGNWRAKIDRDTLNVKLFSFRGRDIALAGIGAGGSPRGLNIKFVRPDVVIMDDIQTREDAPNLEMANELMVWMLGTLMKACHPQICTFMFVGNMYPFEGCVLRKLKHSKMWLSLITGAITADAQSIWPEHRSIDDLLDELETDTEQGHPEVFFSEVMNDEEAGTVSGIDVSKIHECPAHLDMHQAQGGFIIIDPSLGKKKSDDVAIGAILVFDGTPVVREFKHGKFSPGETIQHATFLAIKYKMRLIVAEAVGYQETLVYWFKQIYQQLGVEGIEVQTVSPEGMAKNARIRDMLKLLLTGKILLHKDVRATVIYQITQWNPMKINNKDDLLDVCAYVMKVIAMYPHLITLFLEDLLQDQLPDATFSTDLALGF